MYPPPPFNAPSAPNAPGPDGLEAGVASLFKAQSGSGAPPNPMDVYEALDPQVLLDRFKDHKKDGEDIRWVFERIWWRVMLYLLDRQWIFFDAKRNEWRDKRLKKWVPKPVTNKMREVQAAIRAMFSAVELGTVSRPNGNDPKNIATANTVDGLQPLIHEEHRMDAIMRLQDFWMVNLGNCWLYTWWNPDEGEVQNLPAHQCPNCKLTELDTQDAPSDLLPPPTCPECQIPMVPTTQPTPLGKGCTDVVSPFEILVPSYATTFEECRWLIRIRWRPKEYYEDQYPELVPKLSFETQTNERSLHMFKALAAQSNMSTMPFTFGSGTRSQALGLTEYEYWEKPSKTYPKGLFFRVLGDEGGMVLQDPGQSSPGPIPVETVKGEPLWPWVHTSYEEFGGRLFATGAIDPLIMKQDQLNQLDSHTQLAFQRMGNPIWLEPKGAEVEKYTGEPGLVVKYNIIGAGQGKPERIPGEPIPATTFSLRQQYLSDIEELAGTYDILKGQKPTGVEAFSALQLLVERSQSRFTTAFAQRGEAYREWYRIAIELERKYGPTQRTLSLLGPNGTWTYETYLQADLMGDVSIVVEDGTNVPKTALGKRAAMEQAKNMGFVDPTDPDQRYAFLSEMGLTNLMPGLDTAKKAALRNQDAFEKWVAQGMPGFALTMMPQQDPTTGQVKPVPVPQGTTPLKIQPWDDPNILLSELRKWANSDKMQALLNDPQQGQQIDYILTQYFQTLNQMLAPALIGPSPAGEQVPGSPKAVLDVKNQGIPTNLPASAQPGHAAGLGQAMARSNTNSNQTAIVNHGQPTAPPPHVG